MLQELQSGQGGASRESFFPSRTQSRRAESVPHFRPTESRFSSIHGAMKWWPQITTWNYASFNVVSRAGKHRHRGNGEGWNQKMKILAIAGASDRSETLQRRQGGSFYLSRLGSSGDCNCRTHINQWTQTDQTHARGRRTDNNHSSQSLIQFKWTFQS
jgi:hypothetical protein